MLGRLRRILAGVEFEFDFVKRSGCSAAGDLVESSARHDSVEPGAYGAVMAKAGQRSPRPDERLLDRVLRVGARAEHPQGDAVDAGLVPAHEVLERINVTVLGCPNEDRVVDLAIHGLRLGKALGHVRARVPCRGVA